MKFLARNITFSLIFLNCDFLALFSAFYVKIILQNQTEKRKRAQPSCSHCGLPGHNVRSCPDPGKLEKTNNSSSSSSSSAPSLFTEIIDVNLVDAVIAEFEELDDHFQDIFDEDPQDDKPVHPLNEFGAEIFPNNDIIDVLNDIIGVPNDNIRNIIIPERLNDEDIFNLAWEEVEIVEAANKTIRSRSVPISTIPVFKGPSEPHPKNIPPDCKTRLDCFRLFMDDEIVATFVKNTNDYARDTNKKDWKDVDEGDVMRLWAVMFFMGIVQISDRRRYWEEEPSLFGQPFVSNCFAARRFESYISN